MPLLCGSNAPVKSWAWGLRFFFVLGTIEPLIAARKQRKKRNRQETQETAAQAISKGFIEMHGVVEECLPAASFRIRIDNGQIILAHLSGKMRMNRIRLLPGDEVKLEMTPYDLTKGRIVYRY